MNRTCRSVSARNSVSRDQGNPLYTFPVYFALKTHVASKRGTAPPAGIAYSIPVCPLEWSECQVEWRNAKFFCLRGISPRFCRPLISLESTEGVEGGASLNENEENGITRRAEGIVFPG